MTDAEIIKVLEICLNKSGGCISAKCPLVNDLHCKELLISRCFEIISRQQSEIEKLKKLQQRQADLIIEERGRRYELASQFTTLKGETDKTDDEILKKLLTQRVKFIPNNYDIKVIQRHAVREFANKLKKQAFECDISFGLGSQRIRQAVAVDDIDKAVNEMFGNSEQQEGE